MDEGTEPIADEELLYRRVSERSGWYSRKTGLNAEAFAPHKQNDITGLSVARGNYKSIEQSAQPKPDRPYYVAVLRAGDLRHKGIQVVPRPILGDPGHAELPELNAGNRKSDRTLELQRILVELCLRVEGPFFAHE